MCGREQNFYSNEGRRRPAFPHCLSATDYPTYLFRRNLSPDWNKFSGAQRAPPAIDHARILGRATRISWPFSSCVLCVCVRQRERAHLRCRNIPPGIHLMNKHWKLCAQWRGISFAAAAASRWQFLFAHPARLQNKESHRITDRFLPSRTVDARRCLLWAC